MEDYYLPRWVDPDASCTPSQRWWARDNMYVYSRVVDEVKLEKECIATKSLLFAVVVTLTIFAISRVQAISLYGSRDERSIVRRRG